MTRIVPSLLAAVLLAAGPASAQEPQSVDEILSMAEEFCASFENGTFEAGNAVQQVDLDGEPPLDTIVDSAEFACSSMASAYCGTGGCSVWSVVDGTVTEFQAEGWRTTDWADRPILLIARDGGWCGGSGAQLCFEAVTWSQGQMLTVMPPLE